MMLHLEIDIDINRIDSDSDYYDWNIDVDLPSSFLDYYAADDYSLFDYVFSNICHCIDVQNFFFVAHR